MRGTLEGVQVLVRSPAPSQRSLAHSARAAALSLRGAVAGGRRHPACEAPRKLGIRTRRGPFLPPPALGSRPAGDHVRQDAAAVRGPRCAVRVAGYVGAAARGSSGRGLPRSRALVWGGCARRARVRRSCGESGGEPLAPAGGTPRFCIFALWLLRGLPLPVCRCAEASPAWPLFSPVLLPSVSLPTLPDRVGSSLSTVQRTLVAGSSGSAVKLEV